MTDGPRSCIVLFYMNQLQGKSIPLGAVMIQTRPEFLPGTCVGGRN